MSFKLKSNYIRSYLIFFRLEVPSEPSTRRYIGITANAQFQFSLSSNIEISFLRTTEKNVANAMSSASDESILSRWYSTISNVCSGYLPINGSEPWSRTMALKRIRRIPSFFVQFDWSSFHKISIQIRMLWRHFAFLHYACSVVTFVGVVWPTLLMLGHRFHLLENGFVQHFPSVWEEKIHLDE